MEYNYILFSIGKDKSRDNLVPASKLKDYIKSTDIDVLTSLWRYGDEAIQYYQKNRTLTGYRGSMYAQTLTLDIDSHREPLEIALSMGKEFVKQMNEKGIEPKIYFSGNAGLHISISAEYFGGFQASSVLPAQLLALAKNLTNINFDKSIFGHLRMFRLTNTLHHKSGLYKIPIRKELLDYPAKILELAKTQQPAIKQNEVEPIPELIKLKEQCFDLVPNEDDSIFNFTDIKPKNKLCINELLKGVSSGHRNDVLCRITSHFKKEGYTPELTYEFVHAWNKFNKPPIDKDELKVTFKSVWENGYTYSCFDWLLDDNCNKDCYLYANKNFKNIQQKLGSTETRIYRFGEIEKTYEEYINAGVGVNLGFSKKIDEEISGGIDPGDLVFIVGRPACYKSSICQMIANYFCDNYIGYFLYISLEMSLPRLYERQLQVMTGKTAQEIRENFKTISISRDVKEKYLITDKKGLSIPEIKKLVIEWETTNQAKIEIIAIDFFHALKIEGGEAKTKAENALKMLKQLAYELNTRIVTLVHTSRSGGGDSYKSLDISSARDSALFEDVGDFSLGLHKIKEDDSILMVQLLKNKKGSTLDIGVRMRRSKTTIFLEEDNSLYLPIGE